MNVKLKDWPVGTIMRRLTFDDDTKRRMEELIFQHVKADLPENAVIACVEVNIHFDCQFDPSVTMKTWKLDVTKSGPLEEVK